jgi:hypothetical protein
MRPSTDAVQQALLQWESGSNIQIADLYTFTLQTGEIWKFSGFQTPLRAPAPNTDSPLIYYQLGPPFNRTKTKNTIGTHVDELEVDIFAGPNDSLGDLSWQDAFRLGLFDGCVVELDRAFLQATPGASFPTVIGTVVWFYGRVGDVDIGRTKITMKVKSLLDLLTVQMPGRLYQSQCNWVFGGTGCGYNRMFGRAADGTYTGIGSEVITCEEGSDQNAIVTSFVPGVSTSYDNGTIVCISGKNVGYYRSISTLSGGSVNFIKPWFYPVNEGVDEFNLLPGCDHTLTTCQSTFQNVARYGGMPYIPPPEVAL